MFAIPHFVLSLMKLLIDRSKKQYDAKYAGVKIMTRLLILSVNFYL